MADGLTQALASAGGDQLSPEVLGNQHLSAEEINSLITQSKGDVPAFSDRDIPVHQTPVTAPPDTGYVPPMQAPPMPQQQYVQPQNQMTPDMLMSQLAQERAERLALQQRTQQAEGQLREFNQWLENNPEVVNQILGVAQPQDPNVPADPMQQMETRLAQMQRRLDQKEKQDQEIAYRNQVLAQQANEAAQIAQQYGNAVDLNYLTEHARSRGIPHLKDALAHALGGVLLDQYHQQQKQQQQYQQQYPQGYPQQYQQQYPQQYPQQQQQYVQQPPVQYAAPPPPEAVVMRPGGSVPPPAQAPTGAPARTIPAAFNRIRQRMGI